MKERFLVEDYTGTKEGEDPKIQVVDEDEIWEVIEATREKMIAVWKIDKCVLDWS